jgi:adenine-specific DNA-methyltransferase
MDFRFQILDFLKLIIKKEYKPITSKIKNPYESWIHNILTELGFIEIKEKNQIKYELDNKDRGFILSNYPHKSFIHEPRGSQSNPDFVIFFREDEKLRYISLECKSSKNTNKAVWNSCLPIPKDHWIYTFINFKTSQKIVIGGKDLITEEVYNFFKFHPLIRSIQDTINKDLKQNLWEFYTRPMYNQKISFDYKKQENYLNNLQIELEEYNQLTKNYISSVDREYRSKLGQFFTPYSLVEKLFTAVFENERNLIDRELMILEPCVGTCQFIDVLLKRKEINNKSQIHLYEIDEKIKIKSSDVPSRTERYSYFNKDFLKEEISYKYDLIIGNPPYYELIDTNYTSDLKIGRYNIYALFLEKCIKLLADNGILAFILPTSLRTSPTYRLLREFIINTCNILYIKDEYFSDDVAQPVMIFIIQKRSGDITSKKFVTKDNMFAINYEEINNTPSIILEDLPVTFSTGKIVWNQHKSNLSNVFKEGMYKIIYSSDISEEGISEKSFDENSEKKRYILCPEISPLTFPVILIQRSSKNLRFCLIKSSDIPLVAENHVNCINSLDFQKENPLELIISSFQTSEFQRYISEMSTTSNFTLSQLKKTPLFKNFKTEKKDFESLDLKEEKEKDKYSRMDSLKAEISQYIKAISTEHNIPVEELLKLWDDNSDCKLRKEVAEKKTSSPSVKKEKCVHIVNKRDGTKKQCDSSVSAKSTSGKYCSRHLSQDGKEETVVATTPEEKPKSFVPKKNPATGRYIIKIGETGYIVEKETKMISGVEVSGVVVPLSDENRQELTKLNLPFEEEEELVEEEEEEN